MKIESLTNDIFKTTNSGIVITQHEVTVTYIAYHHLTREQKTREELLDLPTKFLLGREPNTSILAKFDITGISQYFAEYETELLEILN